MPTRAGGRSALGAAGSTSTRAAGLRRKPGCEAPQHGARRAAGSGLLAVDGLRDRSRRGTAGGRRRCEPPSMPRAGTPTAGGCVLDYIDDMGSLSQPPIWSSRAPERPRSRRSPPSGSPPSLVPYPYATDDHQTQERARHWSTPVPRCSSPTPSWMTNASVTCLLGLLGDARTPCYHVCRIARARQARRGRASWSPIARRAIARSTAERPARSTTED